MEVWDAYDKDLVKIDGVTLIRGETIPEGIFHLVCDIIVRHADGSWLLMQRDGRKPFGGMWEATAGGSALKGESPAQCAARELREETGIAPDSLKELGRVRTRDTVYVEYLCVTNCKKDSVRLQEGETAAWQWVSSSALVSMPESELVTHRIQRFIDELKP